MRVLETERLVLRPFTMDDLDDLHREIYADGEVLHFYSARGVRTYEETRQYLADHLAVWQDGELGRLAVIRAADRQFLGQIHLDCYVNWFCRWAAEPDPSYNSLEVDLTFALGRRFWGQGYAYEASEAMIRYAFGELRLRRLVGFAHVDNVRSIRLQQRLGFRAEPNLHPDWPGYVMILENNLIPAAR